MDYPHQYFAYLSLLFERQEKWAFTEPAEEGLASLVQLAGKSTVVVAIEREWWDARRPKFGHAVEVQLDNQTLLMGSYHPSQQNTFTGRLTEEMFDRVFRAIRKCLDADVTA